LQKIQKKKKNTSSTKISSKKKKKKKKKMLDDRRIRSALRGVAAFSRSPDAMIRDLAALAVIIDLARAQELFREGDPVDAAPVHAAGESEDPIRDGEGPFCYIVVRGSLAVATGGSSRAEARHIISPGSIVGEVALFARPGAAAASRNATVFAREPSRVARLSVWHIRRCAGREELAKLAQLAETRDRARDAVKGTPLLRDVAVDADAMYEACAKALRAHRCAQGDVVVRQGEPGDSLFIIGEGRFEIRVADSAARPRVLAELTAGSWFGEVALLRPALRNASVVCLEPGEVHELSRSAYLPMAEMWPEIGDRIEKYASKTVAARDRVVHPAHAAAREGKYGEWATVIAARLSERAEGGWTPFHEMCAEGHLELVKLALAQTSGQCAQWRTDRGETALHLAVAGAREEPAESQQRLSDEARATIERRRGTVEALLAAGADPLAADELGETALHTAARVARAAHLIDTLLSRGGGDAPKLVSATNAEGQTPLLAACQASARMAVEALVRHGADPDARDKDGLTALHTAAAADAGSVVEALLAAGAAVDAVDPVHARTALHSAAMVGSPFSIRALLDHRVPADPNQRDAEGRTALHYACLASGVLGVIRALVDAGGDQSLEGEDGRNAYDLALLGGFQSCASFLGDVRRDPVSAAIRGAGEDDDNAMAEISRAIDAVRGQPTVTPENALRAAVVQRDVAVLDAVLAWAASLQWGGGGKFECSMMALLGVCLVWFGLGWERGGVLCIAILRGICANAN
jgi:ankyrin repeat protein/CRP-like cAMP-binding protein